MNYYEVWPGAQDYHKQSPLTYASDEELPAGQVIEIPMRSKQVFGFVARKITRKPKFAVKHIVRSIQGAIIPAHNRELFTWLCGYYPAPAGQIASLFLPKSVPKKPSLSATTTQAKQPLPKLTDEQESITNKLLQTTGTALLHGDTGTGKTRIYAELAKKTIKENKSVVILTPEIGLTPQLVSYFEQHIDAPVIVNHSGLSAAKRRDIWLELCSAKTPVVVIGPRSSLFLPLQHLGLIVVDEAHDQSYKQEQAPHYQTTRAAAKLAQNSQCLCLLGTATPSITDHYSLTQHKAPIFRLTAKVHKNIKQPKIRVVNRNDTSEFSTSQLCSDVLIEGIKDCKQHGLTSLLFLNRRGTARQVRCSNCGWVATCDNCDLPFTYHHDSHVLRCHTCNQHQSVPLTCPDCDSNELTFRTAGTKALHQELERLFPGYKIAKFDSDNTTDTDLATEYQNIKDGNFDIIVGTQMLAKGLDLPSLGLVGIPFADTSLYLPDYTADEQTYQLITQVIGRVGRTDQATNVIVQSYNPNHPALNTALSRDWESFYQAQLEERRQFTYPPFVYLLKLTISRKTDNAARAASEKLQLQLAEQHKNTHVLPAAPRFYHKQRGLYNWQIIVKAQNRGNLLEIISKLPAGWRYDIDPVSLL